MKEFKSISPTQLTQNTFDLIGKEWMLVTAKKETAINTMTASWGGFGIMWGKPVAFVVIRPQRYTKEFIDASEGFSLSFFQNSFKKQLSYLGTVSGRDENKIQKANLTPIVEDNIPYFEEATLVLKCRKLYAAPMTKEAFIESDLCDKWYPSNDYHTMYIAEITDVLKR